MRFRRLAIALSFVLVSATSLPAQEEPSSEACALYMAAAEKFPQSDFGEVSDDCRAFLNGSVEAPSDSLAAFVARCEPQLEAVVRGAAFRHCKWPEDITCVSTAHLQLAMTLTVRFAIRLRAGQVEVAVRDAKALLAFARHMQEGTNDFFGCLARRYWCRGVLFTLRQGPLPPGAAARLAPVLGEDVMSEFAQDARGHRACWLSWIDNIITNDLGVQDPAILAAWRPIFEQEFRAYGDRLTEWAGKSPKEAGGCPPTPPVDDIKALAKDPAKLMEAVKTKEELTHRIAQLFLGMFVQPDSWTDLRDHHAAVRVLSVVTRTALAIEAFREAHGRRPDSLDELVPGNLPDLPSEAWTGTSLEFQRPERGYLLFATGDAAKRQELLGLYRRGGWEGITREGTANEHLLFGVDREDPPLAESGAREEPPAAPPVDPAREKEAEEAVRRGLSMARNFAMNGNRARALAILDDLVKKYEGTAAVESAKAYREELAK